MPDAGIVKQNGRFAKESHGANRLTATQAEVKPASNSSFITWMKSSTTLERG
jgi:hypothetical protein